MKLLTTSAEIEKEFLRLMQQYDEYYWATAWAGIGSSVFDQLLINSHYIKEIIVGIHFYQTHPEFIKHFINTDNVKFIEQPDGTFHPKVYLFKKGNTWEVIIGSANFTNAAFSRNTEACVLVSSHDQDADEILLKATKLISSCFLNGKTFDETDLEHYTTVWNNHREKLKGLSGKYGGELLSQPKPIHNIQLVTRSWEQYILELKKDPRKDLDRRLKVIKQAQLLFKKTKHFHELETNN